MNTSIILKMKNIFFSYGKQSLSKNIGTIKPKIICLIFIAFASVFVVGCNDNNGTGATNNKTDTIVQPNNQGEGMDGNHGGMGDKMRGMDSTHRGMDSMDHKKHQ